MRKKFSLGRNYGEEITEMQRDFLSNAPQLLKGGDKHGVLSTRDSDSEESTRVLRSAWVWAAERWGAGIPDSVARKECLGAKNANRRGCGGGRPPARAGCG